MFRLPRHYADEIIAHAREDAPNECCGILAGQDAEILRLYRALNSEQSPYRFNIDPQDLYRIYSEVEAAGWKFIAIYHSHPGGQAYPSSTDLTMAQTAGPGEVLDLWPGVVYLIVSLADPSSPQIRAFRLERGTVAEETLHLTD
jgi:proteasome lid subunit RPN8/RPN11